MFADKTVSIVQRRLTDSINCWNESDGLILADLLMFENIHDSNRSAAEIDVATEVLNYLQSFKHSSGNVEELVILHLKSQHYLIIGQLESAFNALISCVQLFIKQMQSHKDNWALPVMIRLVTDARTLAFRCVDEKVSEDSDKILERTADSLMNCFRICCADTRSDVKHTKRWGMLHLVNQLFKIYFRMNNTKLCKPLIRAIEGSNLKNDYMKAQLVTYKFFLGKIELVEGNFDAAEESLTYAFNNRHPSCYENTRKVLNYLVPLKMLKGVMPSRYVIRKYDLTEYRRISEAIKVGNVRLLQQHLDDKQLRYVAMGIFVVMEKLILLAYRNLFKKIYNIMNQTHQLNLNLFFEALKFCGPDEDIEFDETEFIVANLIAKGFIKGYISHQHAVLVVSKQNPFPALTFLR
ncbi:PCI domain-containing protein 2-like [Symsagittifera roscoffensis]|uniref:PCI domain-containing protein 2-like n=1 Tax=Symsagittifera roscoffensis TaxID=84072 RepID=UPI00307B4E34